MQKKRLFKALFVTETTHKKVFKRKIDRSKEDIDALINYLLEQDTKLQKLEKTRK